MSVELRQFRRRLCDVVKTTKYWHMCGPHFRDYQLFRTITPSRSGRQTDDMAERSWKLGGTILHFISEISKLGEATRERQRRVKF